MKTVLVILFFLITGVVYSQIHYVRVTPKYEQELEYRGEEYYRNVSQFFFLVPASERSNFKYCTVSGYFLDHPLDNKLVFKTGFDYEYTEAETQTDSSGYFEVNISTVNLPNLAIYVFYTGAMRVKLKYVDISCYGSKY